MNQDFDGRPFDGAKLALFLGARLAVILRDENPNIPYPGFWDLPGGGREGNETPLDCALRETWEELSLVVPPETITWHRRFHTAAGQVWFLAAHLPERHAQEVRLGDEGQTWALMTPEAYLQHGKAIPPLQDRLRLYLAG